MKKTKRVLAIDIGASGGKAFIGSCEENIEIKEIYRFDNLPTRINGTLYWDVLALFNSIKQAMLRAGDFDSVAIDTWGVDYAFIDERGGLMANPVHYRDTRTAGIIEKLGIDDLYMRTGTQLMEFNTIFQLKAENPRLLEGAESMLMMPDLLGYFLTGERVTELSNAATTGLLDLNKMEWNFPLIDEISIPRRIFTRLAESGSVVGRLREDIARELGIDRKPVIAVASHDTACAITGMPSAGRDYAFLSCGTWSLLGVELDAPVISRDSYNANLTNEVGYRNKIDFLKNIVGLWLIQEAKRVFAKKGKSYSYADMSRLAQDAEAFKCFVDPDAADFFAPSDMCEAVVSYCARTNQYVPQSDGEIIRCIYESLAMKYRFALMQIEQCTRISYKSLRIGGGGIQDEFLCRAAANAIGIPVITGPIEATALGNVMIQLIANRVFESFEQANECALRSFEVKTYPPCEHALWDEHYTRFKKIIGVE